MDRDVACDMVWGHIQGSFSGHAKEPGFDPKGSVEPWKFSWEGMAWSAFRFIVVILQSKPAVFPSPENSNTSSQEEEL